MIYFYVLTAIVAAINGIGMRHTVPLTSINPSSSFLSRTFSSLEIAASIHGLRSLQPIVSPLVFPSHSAGIENDLLIQHTLHLKTYKDAKVALEKSSASLAYLPISRNGTKMNHLNQVDEELWDRKTPQSQFDISHWVPWVIAVLAMQAFALMMIFDIKCRHRVIEKELCGLWNVHEDQCYAQQRLISGIRSISPESPNSVQRYEGIVLKQLKGITSLSSRIMEQICIMSRESDRVLTNIDGKLGQASLDTSSIQQRTTKISNAAKQLKSYYGNLSEDISYGVDLLGLSRMAPETVDSDDAPLSPGSTASKRDASSPDLRLQFPLNSPVIPGNSSPGSSSGSTTPTPSNPKTPRHTPSPSPVPGSTSPKPAPLPPVPAVKSAVSKPASPSSVPAVKSAVSKPASPPSKPTKPSSKPAPLPPVPALKPSVSKHALLPSKPTSPLPKRITLPPVPPVPASPPSKPAPQSSVPAAKLPVSNGINGQPPLNWHNGPPPTD
ncbi:unnamed protein product [Penicillium salamii]|uniref:Uncharacterized protein n=1 Tax=Penicillium salamii TaxID=1612424 RepID=A0A9W4NC69_9EURO|nr:unnamed protein product [Penicillium salamii]